ncbi:MAG: hypothetical protein WA761_03925 [Thermoplasmata archaeon]
MSFSSHPVHDSSLLQAPYVRLGPGKHALDQSTTNETTVIPAALLKAS